MGLVLEGRTRVGGKQAFPVGGRVCVCQCILDSSGAKSPWFPLSISEVRVQLGNVTQLLAVFFSFLSSA